jgi:hypothetical protein
MTSLRASRIAVAALAVLAWAAISNVANAKDPKDFVIHEWGTFSTFSGSNGTYLKFYPNDGDLPQFVYSRHRKVKGGLPDSFVSLETPVMYFYSDRERNVSVNVEFPKGMMTDWYPQASRPPDQGLRWDNIKILADSQATVSNSGKGRYFAARETDASLLQVTEMGKKENEKFLFYRGVGDFTMPFTVRADGNYAFWIKNSGKDEVPGFFLVRVEGKKVYFKASGHLSPSDEVRVQQSDTASTAEKLGDAVAKLLTEQGLYEKEAQAMVKTWSADWFGQDGTRVIYVVPESLTKELLPLKIDPKPDQLVRVLVGRHDILTPEREKEIDALVKRLNSDSNADSQAVDKILNQLGRYRWAAQTASANRLKSQDAARNRR